MYWDIHAKRVQEKCFHIKIVKNGIFPSTFISIYGTMQLVTRYSQTNKVANKHRV